MLNIIPLSTVCRRLVAPLSRVEPLLPLAARLYVGHAFWASALTKLRDWDSTLFLFQEEYQVPCCRLKRRPTWAQG